ncbi:MAG: 16S rRNA (cytidine(1402)-2'-O)-methyltransferase [Bacilli bacterium]|nr:16S rRNA (cytidine(1402)-2'-O)-methyltransferase [Bacilli bacterium]
MIQKSYDNKPKLYIVPTPIGNLEDITLRALRILKEVDVIFAEDTRTTNILLKHYDINQKLLSSHLYNEEKMQEKEIDYLKEGKNIAVVSDAGTPVISDPGYILVKNAIKEGYNVICLPGPTAIIPAVVMSGLAGGPFTYYGFLNSKESKRKKELETLKNNPYPIVFYEAPHRIIKTLNNIKTIFGNRNISIVREISKKYEEVSRDNVENILKTVENFKGEIVLVVEGNSKQKNYDELSIIKHIELYIEDGMTSKDAIKIVAKERNLPKSEVYMEYVNNRN